MDIVTLFDLEALLKVTGAAAIGAVLGIERHLHGRAAGLRTNALVCMASALLIVVSRGAALQGMSAGEHFNLNVDPSRMAAGVITGIGFLGAGSILRLRDNFIRGLTTAAEIWFIAALGIAIGYGEYVLAAAAALLALLALVSLHHVERRIHSVVYRSLAVSSDADRRLDVEAACRAVLAAEKIGVQETNYSIDLEARRATVTFSLRSPDKRYFDRAVAPLAAVPGIGKLELV
jgi:putative Mg2+ transporter-C (MgtC) family protein